MDPNAFSGANSKYVKSEIITYPKPTYYTDEEWKQCQQLWNAFIKYLMRVLENKLDMRDPDVIVQAVWVHGKGKTNSTVKRAYML